MAITVTTSAIEHIKHALSVHNGKYAGIKIDLRKSGCSGSSYTLEFIQNDKITELMTVLEIGEFKLVYPTKNEQHFNGMILDFKKQKFESGFDFMNPNEKSRCGCGSSVEL